MVAVDELTPSQKGTGIIESHLGMGNHTSGKYTSGLKRIGQGSRPGRQDVIAEPNKSVRIGPQNSTDCTALHDRCDWLPSPPYVVRNDRLPHVFTWEGISPEA